MKKWIHASSGGSDILSNMIDRVDRKIREGQDPEDAIVKVCDEFGYAHDSLEDSLYRRLLIRFGLID